jgi:hypothetical protein
MLTSDFTTNGTEETIAERACELFCGTFGLSWNDSIKAARYEDVHGLFQTQRVLNLLYSNGNDWDRALDAITKIDNHRMAA